MTKKKTAIPAKDLGAFEGRPVLGTAIKITNAGDGLSAAVAVDPAIHHHGDKVFVVLETEVANVAHPPVKDTNGVTRLHTLKTVAATIVDEDMVRDVLDAQKVRIERAAGIHTLPFAGDEDERSDEDIIGGGE